MTNSPPHTPSDTPSDTQPNTPAIPKVSGKRPAHRWPRLWGRRMWLLLTLGALLLCYRVATVHYSGISLFFDEAQYWDWSRHLQWGYFSKPPMIAGLVALSTGLFGDSVIGVKLLSMLTYILTAVAIVGLSRALWPTSSGVRTGIVAGGLFLTAPMVGLLGMFASTDAPLLLCWTLAAWALWRAQVTNRASLWILCGAICGLGMLSKYTMGAFAVTALWALWGVQGPKRGLWRLGPWLSLSTALAVFSPNIFWNMQMGFPTLEHTAAITTESTRDGGFMSVLTFLVGQLLMLGPVAVLAGFWLHRHVQQMPADVSSTQWAASSQMMPPSQWASGHTTGRTPRSSAYYLASVTSYRYLIALGVPLMVLATVQAFMAGAHVNWAAPAIISLLLLLATRLSPPLVPLATKRPNNWLWAVVISNVLMTAAVVHARDILADRLPAQLDVLQRMRGWSAAFEQLDSQLNDPRVQGLPIVAQQRTLLAQASYHWRHHQPRIMAWNPAGTRDNHYQLQQSMPNTVGQDVLLLTNTPDPKDMLARFAIHRELGRVAVSIGPGRQNELYLFMARGFVGYDNATYEQQSGAAGNTAEDKPFTQRISP